jgi:hypothetical protein
VTYDTDAGMLDDQSKFFAETFYFITDRGQTGTRFMGMSPYSKQAIEEFGGDEIKNAAPFQAHMYEVTGKVEAPYEVYVQAKYVGLYQDSPAAQ